MNGKHSTGAMVFTISGFSTPPADSPRKMSASRITSASVRADVGCAKRALSSSISTVRPSYTTPSMSVTQMCSRGRPSSTSSFRQASAAAPAPLVTSFTFFRSLPRTLRPFCTAAPTMIAVPCWSSWKTGIFIRSRSLRST